MLSAVRQAGVLCQVNMILRWHPMIESIVRLRDEGALGQCTLSRRTSSSASWKARSLTGRGPRRAAEASIFTPAATPTTSWNG